MPSNAYILIVAIEDSDAFNYEGSRAHELRLVARSGTICSNKFEYRLFITVLVEMVRMLLTLCP